MEAKLKSGFVNHISTRSNLIRSEIKHAAAKSEDSSSLQGGLRAQGIFKQSSDDKPLVTVVTVVYNNASTIEETIRSVLFQTYDNVEYIIIDGGSDDGTLEIIKSYDDFIDYWVSEPDKGIYHAMNKGIPLAGGQYINFLNADDHYLYSGVLEKITGLFRRAGSQIIIGDAVMLSKQSGAGHIRHSNVNRYYYLFKGMPQQVFFYDTGLFKTDLFDDSLVIAADLDFYLTKMKDEKVRITNVNWPVVVFNTGATGSNADLLAKEREGIVRKHYSWVERLLFQNRFFRSLFVTNDLNAKKPGIVDRAIRKFTS
jgi:glycosyltransferase involved in cell wall biosynthesis